MFRPADINETLECWKIAFIITYLSVIALSDKLPYINPSFSENNKCEKGAYVVNITSHDNKVTLIASGSEVELALNVQNELKKIMSIQGCFDAMPRTFDKQSNDFKKDILDEDSLIVTIEAGNVSSWKKYLGKKVYLWVLIGLVNAYKKIYNHLNLSVEKILTTIQNKLRE